MILTGILWTALGNKDNADRAAIIGGVISFLGLVVMMWGSIASQ